MNLVNEFTVKQVFETMKKNGWNLEDFESTMQRHLQVLELQHKKIDFIEHPKDWDMQVMYALEFITDFIHAIKEVNKGKNFLR